MTVVRSAARPSGSTNALQWKSEVLWKLILKRHKAVIAYFNKTYVAMGKIPKEIGRKLARLQQKREKSDYDDFYLASKEETCEQTENTREIIMAAQKYISTI